MLLGGLAGCPARQGASRLRATSSEPDDDCHVKTFRFCTCSDALRSQNLVDMDVNLDKRRMDENSKDAQAVGSAGISKTN